MLKPPENKETFSSLLFLICALTFLFIYGGMMTFSPYKTISIGLVCIVVSSAVGFLAVCGLCTYGLPEQKPFYVGFLFGLVPAHVISLFLGASTLSFLLGNTEFFAYLPMWGVCIFLGSAVWGLAAIPTCAIFRQLFARLRKD